MPVPDLLAVLADRDASPRLLEGRLRDNAWVRYDEGQRRLLRPDRLRLCLLSEAFCAKSSVASCHLDLQIPVVILGA